MTKLNEYFKVAEAAEIVGVFQGPSGPGAKDFCVAQSDEWLSVVDDVRLTGQIRRIYNAMVSGRWLTL